MSSMKCMFSCKLLRSERLGIAIISNTNAVGPSSGASLTLNIVPYPCMVLKPFPQNKCVSYK